MAMDRAVADKERKRADEDRLRADEDRRDTAAKFAEMQLTNQSILLSIQQLLQQHSHGSESKTCFKTTRPHESWCSDRASYYTRML
jgi:hypothetical protein